jgi:hypothetical protein
MAHIELEPNERLYRVERRFTVPGRRRIDHRRGKILCLTDKDLRKTVRVYDPCPDGTSRPRWTSCAECVRPLTDEETCAVLNGVSDYDPLSLELADYREYNLEVCDGNPYTNSADTL